MIIKNYLKDKIVIVSESVAEDQSITEIESDPISARVEESHKMVTGQDGNEVMSRAVIMIEDMVLRYTDKIKVTELKSNSQLRAGKEYAILTIERSGGFKVSHIEVYL